MSSNQGAIGHGLPTPYFDDGRRVIYHGDSMEILPMLKAGVVDAVVTDPPYVIGAAIDAGLPITSMMVWDKEWIGPGGPQGLRPSYEMVALMCRPDFAIEDRGTADIWRHKVGSYKASGHPAEKPEGLVRRILEASRLDGASIVLDPFMGSGTTLVAAKGIGLRCVGVEAEERYCHLAAERLAQGALFEDHDKSTRDVA